MHDGRLELAAAEEKFDNIKRSGGPPLKAIAWLLEESGLRPADIDAVAHAGMVPPSRLSGGPDYDEPHGLGAARRLYASAEYRLFGSAMGRATFRAHRRLRRPRAAAGREDLRRLLASTFGFPADRMRWVEHHACHAHASAGFFGDDGRDWLILTMDAAGDDHFATVNRFSGGQIQRLASTGWEHSLGWMYARTTEFLGLRRGEHHKLMGLAAYPSAEDYSETLGEVFEGVAWLRPGSLEFDSRIPMYRFDRHLRQTAVGRRFDYVAAAAQALLEELVVQWVGRAIELTGIPNVMTGGGVFMNVKVNKRVQELPEVRQIRFMPSCGDETNPIGAAFKIARDAGEDVAVEDGLYLGPRYGEEQVRDFVDRNGLRDRYGVTQLGDPEAEIAELIARKEIVGRVAGRAELGARALGNRSILAHPGDLRSFYTVNDQIKERDFWMPFAPAVLEEDAGRYLLRPPEHGAPYMITAFDTTPAARDDLRAAIHQKDLTVRPQLVTAAANRRFHRLLTEFKTRTGIGGVLSTSLNIHGYPLAATLDQALFTFERSGLRYLVLEDTMLKKDA
ncbi:MAG: carbamoyltransferase [Solirubrobacterales bacterium]|nr:carbamoyltransferase [Solirubrobacterales bacterium]